MAGLYKGLIRNPNLGDSKIGPLRWLTAALCSAVFIAPVGSASAWLNQERPFAYPKRAAFITVSDAPGDVAAFRVAAQGRIEPITEAVDLAIGLVGTLAAVYVNEGDVVTEGQLL